jgi:3,5-epimerase/4-reductase
MIVLIYGARGFIGQYLVNEIEKQHHHVLTSNVRVDNVEDVLSELTAVRPDRVICCVGRTRGKSVRNVDYLQTNLFENVRDNLFAPITLAQTCRQLHIHCTLINSGCIFEYKSTDDLEDGFHEDDKPNFFGSSYSIMKGFTDRMLHHDMLKDVTLNVRIRMPITDEPHPYDFVTKIISYPKICSVPNSMTHLPSLLPLLVDMIEHKLTGTINLVNPGLISHKEILEMVPHHSCTYITEKELSAIVACGRSNNKLCTKRLEMLYPDVLDIHQAIEHVGQARGWM